jgi:hypothetical protein
MGWADMGLLPARGGAILYAARNRPRQTREFYFPYDEEFCARAEANIARVKLHFLGGSLPQRDPSWRWTETPCDWCDFKKHACKPDVKADTIQITESKAIDFSLSVNPMYSYAEARDAVLSRWGAGTKNDEEEAA